MHKNVEATKKLICGMCLRSKLCKNFQSAAKKIFFWPFWGWGEKFADDQQTRLKIFLDRSKTKVGTFKNSFIIKNRSEKINYAFLSRLRSTELMNCPNDWDWKVQLKTVCWRVQLKVFPEKNPFLTKCQSDVVLGQLGGSNQKNPKNMSIW